MASSFFRHRPALPDIVLIPSTLTSLFSRNLPFSRDPLLSISLFLCLSLVLALLVLKLRLLQCAVFSLP